MATTPATSWTQPILLIGTPHFMVFTVDCITSPLSWQPFAAAREEVDYARERLWLRRRPDARVTLLGIDYTYPETGALFLPHRKGYQVILVREGSAAQARGLEPGQILSEAALPPTKDATPDRAGGQQ